MIVLQEATKLFLPFVNAREHWIQDAGRSINLVNWRLKVVGDFNLLCLFLWILVVDPASVNTVHVYSMFLGQIVSRRPRKHIQRCFSHVGMRVIRRLEPVKFACR